MAAGDYEAHGAFLEALLTLAESWTWKIGLFNGWTPDPDTDSEYADISAFEVSLSGYTAGGKTLTNVAVSLTSGTAKLDADDVTWTSLGAGTVSRAAVLANDGVTNWIAGNIELTEQPDGTDYTIVIDGAGLLTLAQGA